MLHVHSCYQCYDSAVTSERLVEKAIQSKLRYVALCDTNFFGAQKLFSFAHQKGILPIIGKECQTEEGRVSCYACNRHGYNLLVQYHNNRVTFTAILEAPEILKVFQYAVEKTLCCSTRMLITGSLLHAARLTTNTPCFSFPRVPSNRWMRR